MSTAQLPLAFGACKGYEGKTTNACRRRQHSCSSPDKTLRPGSYLIHFTSDGIDTDETLICWMYGSCLASAFICVESSVHVVAIDRSFDLKSLLQESFNFSQVPTTMPNCKNSAHIHILLSTHAPTNDTFSNCRTGYVGALSEQSISVLSLSVSATRISTGCNSKQPYPQAEIPLLQAALKRSLVGIHFLWSEGCFTSTIQLAMDDIHFLLTIHAVTANQTRGVRTHHYNILPSTRIIVSFKETDRSEGKINSKIPKASEGAYSVAARLLIETMEGIRKHHNVSLSRSFVFTGQPGIGKTYAIRMAEEALGSICHLSTINGSEITTDQGHRIAAELEQIFLAASQLCSNDTSKVALIFLDEFDALVVSDQATAVLASLLDRVSTDTLWRRVVLVAATNRIDSIPTHLRRPGRFDREIIFAPPNVTERTAILASTAGRLNLQISPEHLDSLAEACIGYVPADLVALLQKALVLRLTKPKVDVAALLDEARESVGASVLRESAVTTPPQTTWFDIAGDCGGAKLSLQQAIEWPRSRRKAYQALNLEVPRGVLLYGPPGTGKTLLARAAAGSARVAFLSLAPADVYASSFVGDAEAVIRRAFSVARAASPCVLFFDEIDSIIGLEENNMGHGMSRGHSAEARTLSTFLNELDGISGSANEGVIMLAATNRPWVIDKALLRPGRFDKIIYVPPPNFEGRRSILERQCHRWNTDSPSDFHMLANDDITGGMTGAELVGVCREVAMHIFNEGITNGSSRPCLCQNVLLDTLRRAKALSTQGKSLQEFKAFQSVI